MSNPVPERLINFRVYLGGNTLAGEATIDLPALEPMTDTVSGAGIAGEVDSPLLGHFQSMTSSITWRTITRDALKLAAPKAHELEARGSQQVYNAGTGEYSTTPVRVAMRAVPKNVSLGTFEVGSTTDTETEFEINYLKVDVGGVTRVEIDKFNYKCVIDGVDYLASVRRDLGLN